MAGKGAQRQESENQPDPHVPARGSASRGRRGCGNGLGLPVRESERDRKPSKGVTWSDSVQKRESHDHVVGGFRGREESGRPVRGQEAVRGEEDRR